MIELLVPLNIQPYTLERIIVLTPHIFYLIVSYYEKTPSETTSVTTNINFKGTLSNVYTINLYLYVRYTSTCRTYTSPLQRHHKSECRIKYIYTPKYECLERENTLILKIYENNYKNNLIFVRI